MRSPKVYSKKNGPKRGSILLFTLLMLTMAAIAVYTITNMVSTNMRQVQKAESRLRAFYAAESGVEQVTDWFNRAYYAWLKQQIVAGVYQTTVDIATLHTWEDNAFTNATFQSYFTPWTAENSDSPGQLINSAGESCFGQLLDKEELIIGVIPPPVDIEPIAKLDATPDADVYSPYLPTITDPETGAVVAKVQYLRITRPPGEVGSRIVAHVSALGVNPSQAAVTVECDLTAPWVPEIVTPAAILSRGGAASNGQFDVNWGEVWTRNNFVVLNPMSKFPSAKEDKWFGVQTEGHLLTKEGFLDADGVPDTNKTIYCDGRVRGGGGESPILESAGPIYYTPYLESELLSTNNKLRGYESLRQHQVLDWPDYNYMAMKAFFLRQGYPIYKTTSAGLLTGPDPVTGEIVTKSFEDLFNLATRTEAGAINDPDKIPWDEMPPLYFIDTTDGKPPAADGSNLPTLASSGGGPFFYGLFFVAGNLDLGGGGSPPSLDSPEDPDRNIYRKGILKCRLAGLFYTYGSIATNGEASIYGAMFAERGFLGGGGWEIYYDWRLGDPLRNRTSSRTEPAVWDTYNGTPRNTAGETGDEATGG